MAKLPLLPCPTLLCPVMICGAVCPDLTCKLLYTMECTKKGRNIPPSSMG